MATTNSTQYASIHVNAPKVGDPRQDGGRVVPITFIHTVASGETGGASAGASDEVRLCVVPAHASVLYCFETHEAMGATTTAGVTMTIGDADDPNRYVDQADADAAGNNAGIILFAGLQFIPTADSIVLLEWGTANPVVGQVVKGLFLIVPGS